VQNQTEDCVFIYWKEDETIVEAMSKRNITSKIYGFTQAEILDEGAWLENNKQIIITTNKQQNNQLKMSIHDLAMQGKHNVNNSMAAGIAGKVLEIRKEIIRESLSDFQNVEHRLEFVARIHGIEFINDSKATNVNSTWYALESINKPLVWIAGGVDKGNDYSSIMELVKSKVHTLICLGTDNSKLHETFGEWIENIADASTADEAVALAYQHARKEQVVLLSPACASFDLFENYEERGNAFKRAVKAL
jgi:UDP-N-acetylmuramoylalanine--D-glutamate ligase